jgi:hypothetical protein
MWADSNLVSASPQQRADGRYYNTSTILVGMSPTSRAKPKQVAFTLSQDEHRMLRELAESEGRSAANWLRFAIRSAHAAKVARSSPRRGKR